MSLETEPRTTTSSGVTAGAAEAQPTVLIVDDHAVNRDLLRAYLKHEDYRLLEADDGFTALEVLAREQVDLVLLDVMMPRLNGFATCARLKEMPRGRFLPVILVTALDDQDSRNRGLSAGADDFLSRPVDRHELLIRVRAFLKLRQQEALIQHQVKGLKRVQALKDDLVTFVFNDLRSPLAGVDGCLQVLRSGLRSPSFAPLLADVDRAVAAMARVHVLLDDILDVRLLEEGELKIEPAETPLQALVVAAAATLEGAARARRIEVRISPESKARALLDPRLVRRAVENLVANALRRSPDGGAVDVEIRREPDGVAIEVADRGAAIPDEVKRRLFAKFGLLDGPRGAPQGGVGVGLHLVKLVAGLHGGTASVSDREGGGSVFRLVVSQEARS